ncbi:MAG: homoserine dehydrogenase [Rudaea sp.]
MPGKSANLNTRAVLVAANRNAIVNIAIIGASGRVGRQLLGLIATRPLAQRLRLVAVANSTRWLALPEGVAAAHAAETLSRSAPVAAAGLCDALLHLPKPLIVVDCTASSDVVACYPRWLAAGIDIVTPNKLGPSADRPLANAIAAALAAGAATLRDSTTVGAQLPLLGTLRELRDSGDHIERFEAVLSGTLSFVLGRVHEGAALSTALREAIAVGYAEPHPGRDLSGEDAARKLVILLRALGEDIDFEAIERVPLVDAGLLHTADPAVLLQSLEAPDASWRARVAIAQARHERWVYRASFERCASGRLRARVAPERVVRTHPLACLAPCENALILRSNYYRVAPLTITGPGAGTELTAAGVFADLLAAARGYAVRGVTPDDASDSTAALVAAA